ncbi:hypothetical protein LPJ64_005642 [Coemansia asiatica]|uniref:Uncharacterized protein n=1 Tax=Coemansia asiatica TaxID=1052880 RepID=A0A9W7XHB3_9FUNG|nr:hypothetical protein LPJ64_005642 [Coemansia asiatica]
MAHIDTTTVRTRLPRLPLSGIPGISRTGSHQLPSHRYYPSQQLHYSQQQKQQAQTQTPHTATALGFSFSSNLSQDGEKPMLAPSKERCVAFVYGAAHGSTMVYLESMLAQLSAKCSESGWSYGVLLSDHTLTPRDRILVNGKPVASALFEKCTHECRQGIDDKSARISPRNASVRERQNAILVNIALRVFSSQNVSLIAVAVPDSSTGNSSSSQTASRPEQRAGADDGDESTDDASCYVEKMVVAMHGSRSIICGVEALPAYAGSLPDRWRRSLVYLMQKRVHLVSSLQPKPVRLQLLSLAKTHGLTVDLAQPLSSLPATRDVQLGLSGAGQPESAALALALCQTWAHQSGILRQRALAQGVGEYTAAMALSPLRQQSKIAMPTSPLLTQMQPGMRDTPQWMLRGLSGARCTGLFDSMPAEPGSRANWHFSWAETPADFARTGEWFRSLCQQKSTKNPRFLLIHLPESFITTVNHQRSANGQQIASDYRDMLRSLYLPLRDVQWACCVFAAGILNELNVMESSVPPVLSQYVLREHWSQLSGQPTDQILIAPSLASAFRLIASASTTRLHLATETSLPLADSTMPKVMSPGVGSRSAYFEPPSTPRQAQAGFLQPSPSSSNIFSLTTRPQRALSKASVLKNATSMDNLRESRRKFSLGLNGLGNESTASLPLRTPKTAAAQSLAAVPMTAPMAAGGQTPAPKVDILVTGAKSFVHSTIIFAKKQAITL